MELLNYRIVSRATPPDDLPVSVESAREYAVLGNETDRDATIRQLIVSARDWIEDVCRTVLVPSTVEQKLDCFPIGRGSGLRLVREPVRSITSITYINTSDVVTTIAATDYKLELGSNPPRIYLKAGKSWPSDIANEAFPITITYEAGPALGESPRGGFVQAVKLLLTFHHEFPSGVSRGGEPLPLPPAVMNVLSPTQIRGYP